MNAGTRSARLYRRPDADNRDARFVKSHVIVSLKLVSASYSWEEGVSTCVLGAGWGDFI
jgi:hypothetical protein